MKLLDVSREAVIAFVTGAFADLLQVDESWEKSRRLESVLTLNTLPQHRLSLSICILTIPSCLLNSSNFAPLSPLVNMSAT